MKTQSKTGQAQSGSSLVMNEDVGSVAYLLVSAIGNASAGESKDLQNLGPHGGCVTERDFVPVNQVTADGRSNQKLPTCGRN